MSRTAIQTFEDYQKSRVAFVQSVAELATRPQNIPALQQAGAISLLRPLLLDTLPSIQQSAALALGRLASHNEELATAVVQEDVLPQLIFSLNHQNRYYKRAAAFVLRAVAKQSPKLAEEVVKAGALDALIGCLEEFDPSVKEAAAWALGYLARHTPELASSVIDAGAIPLLVLSYREPELGLKRVAASALADIAKHSQDLAQAVVDGGAVTLLARDAGHSDAQLKRQVFSCLAHIAKHSIDLAETVVEAEIFPRILHSLGDADEAVRKNAATCMREICRHSVELAKFVVNAGGAVALVDLAADSRGSCRLPAVMGLGYISAFAESLALAVVVARGIPALKDALVTEPEDHIRAAAAWALGCIGRHSPEHARALAEGDVLRRLLSVYMDSESSADLKSKTKTALQEILVKCTNTTDLEPLLLDAPPDILSFVIHQYAKLLPHDLAARRLFVQSGCLQKVLELKNVEPGSQLQQHIDEINALYPPEIVNYYSPGYSDDLMKRLEEYAPSSATSAAPTGKPA
eukprot:GHVT01034892.1.p1 GENE.GHVT01034892.1~~GHVT01034892.1.p1  ORF type:complete len:520 (+),score=114.65 GHVT01034892.1:489-2048(+)